MKHFQKCCAGIILSLAFCLPASAQLPANLANPVLPRVADAGVIRYNGEYYIGGVFTNGGFYRSPDLVNWQGPVHVLSMKNQWTRGASAGDSQIHASDITYLNGTFHHYWSVNYWGQDHRAVHIGHATSAAILGPYREPVSDQWFENRIDPQLFADDDGKLYFYTVKFTDGNTIWGRPMKDPWTFSGEPVYQFASLRGTWETRDNRVAEGPWVMKYRNRYYMMYNANHTGPEWGNYALGVAEAASPLGFGHGNKYAHPVVQSNQADLEDRYADLLRSTGKNFSFSNSAAAGWEQAGFDDSNWSRGESGFGSSKLEGSTTRNVRSAWASGPLFLRKIFRAGKNRGNLSMRIHHDGPAKVWLNGQVVYEHQGRNYTHLLLNEKILIKDDGNVLAIAARPGARSAFIDVSLFDLGADVPDDILFTPGQPNIVRGPNGLEWWLVYMANKNMEPRGQYINRVHFFGNKLVVDGPTASRSAGFHPAPAAAAFSELFEREQPGKWRYVSGDFDVEKGEARHSGKAPLQAFPAAKPSVHYLFEANVRPAGKKPAGIFGWYQDQNNFLQIGLDPTKKSWTWLRKQGNVVKTGQYPLAPDFNFNVYHKLGVQKNADAIVIEIDGRPAPGGRLTGIAGSGLPGVYSMEPATAFDGIVYTIGWDEFGSDIRGWEPQGQTTAWKRTSHGLVAGGAAGNRAVFKGDAAKAYEFSVQISAAQLRGAAGIYAAYAGPADWLKAEVDFKGGTLTIGQTTSGRMQETIRVPLERELPLYIDMRNTDMMEEHFTPDHRVLTDRISFRHEREGKPANMELWCRDGGRWSKVATVLKPHPDRPGIWQLHFAAVEADGFRLVTLEEPGRAFAAEKILVRQISKQSFNLRAVRAGADLLVFADNELVHQAKVSLKESRVGLTSTAAGVSFNGLTFFER
ncbi:glycoside hydrolase [Pedobacter yulinensis]|uniref:Glycoside hydrolase n=1 Tax=Pedobacter yulinensis TaxID=2126353 RepID=A0A2T3HJJ1_9SPHI|nr:family 43 glycosylhydrolase [Pedobacter yulinensis]PST82607.1 glycoside hydrolase [Pedobacter yulinensis]